MFRTPLSNMRMALGPTLPVVNPAMTKPKIQSPAMLLARIKIGGYTEWRNMTYLEKMVLVNEYGYGSEAEFMKKFKQLTGKDLDLRTEAKIQERLDPKQARMAAGLTGGSAFSFTRLFSSSRKQKSGSKRKSSSSRKSKRTQKRC